LSDISKAIDAISSAKIDFVTVQAAAAQGIFAQLPFQKNEIDQFLNTIRICGAKLQEFLSDLSNVDDPNTFYKSAYDTANQIRLLANIVKTIASHATNPQVQQVLFI